MGILLRFNMWEQGQNWKCPTCTFSNNLNVTTCVMCNYQKPTPMSKNESPVVLKVMSMGYAADVVKYAMNKVGEDVERIVAFLLDESGGVGNSESEYFPPSQNFGGRNNNSFGNNNNSFG